MNKTSTNESFANLEKIEYYILPVDEQETDQAGLEIRLVLCYTDEWREYATIGIVPHTRECFRISLTS